MFLCLGFFQAREGWFGLPLEIEMSERVGDFEQLSEHARNKVVRRLYSGKLFPDERAELFRNAGRLFPNRVIKKGKSSPARPESRVSLDDLRVATDTGQRDIYDYFSCNRVVGCVIVQDGETRFERYAHGMSCDTPWMLMSMTKSVCTTLVGAAVQDGFIESIDDPVKAYIPEAKSSAYEEVTIRQLMTMTSGVDWNEDYADPESDRRRMLALQFASKPDTVLDYMLSLPGYAAPGKTWRYSTGDTHVLGALFYRATGRWLSDYLSEKIWSRLGMENDAIWWLDSPGGLEMGGGGICATLRDCVRFAEFMLADGAVDGVQVLPEWWARQAGKPMVNTDDGRTYGFMWWSVPDSEGAYEDGAYSARGIYGQYLYINPTHNLIVGVNSARSKPLNSEAIPDNDFFNAVTRFLT